MTPKILKTSVLCLVLLSLAASDAAAWGPRGQRAVTGTGIQVIRRSFSDAFKAGEANYEDDVLRGAVEGPARLSKFLAMETSTADVLAIIDNQIRLLREVRQYGMGSYFAYHMGLLSALSADVMLPFSADSDPANASVKERIEADIDAHLDAYTYVPSRNNLYFIRSTAEYITKYRTFYQDNKVMIADDYRRGKGYDGYLKEAGPAIFARAVEFVADAWNTVLRVEGDDQVGQPAPSSMRVYFVDEIRYLLEVKRNYNQALRAYGNFEKSSLGNAQAYERIGDLFYAFGTKEATERGVREWRVAYEAQTPDRRRIGQKLAGYYIGVGEALLKADAKPGSADDLLPNAMHAFTQALEFDQTNEIAANRINDTNAAMADRKAHRELNRNILASADQVMVKAEKNRVAGDFGNAIATYKQAEGLYATIDNKFRDQEQAAKESIGEISKSITDILNEVLDQATDTINKGDKAVDDKDFAGGIAAYESVPGMLGIIPDDETTTVGKDKKDLIDLSNKKIDDAKQAEQRWKEILRQREEAAKAAAAQPRPAAPAAPAAPAPK